MPRRQRGEDIGRIFIETPVEITDIIKTRLSPWVGKREEKKKLGKSQKVLLMKFRHKGESWVWKGKDDQLAITSSSTCGRLNLSIPLLYDLLPSFELPFMQDQLHNSHVH